MIVLEKGQPIHPVQPPKCFTLTGNAFPASPLVVFYRELTAYSDMKGATVNKKRTPCTLAQE